MSLCKLGVVQSDQETILTHRSDGLVGRAFGFGLTDSDSIANLNVSHCAFSLIGLELRR